MTADATLFELDDTLTVGELTRRLGQTLKRAFPEQVWVQGQIRNLSRSARNHVYFDLIEPVPAGETPKASISVVLFDANRQVVNRIITRTGNAVRMDDGVEVRIRGTVEYYPPRGQLQLNMDSIDPEFTLGRLGADRDALLRALASEDLIDANRRLELPLVPQRVAVVTSAGSAAHADFTRQLDGSGYRFEVTTMKTRVQGAFAPEEIAEAITAAGSAHDVIALVRGGGSRTDLAAFDAEVVARSIAGAPVPVLAGIGHEIDQSVADQVAHASFKTPTACAQFIVERMIEFDFALADAAQRIEIQALAQPALAAAGIDATATRIADRCSTLLANAAAETTEHASRLAARTTRTIDRSVAQLADRQAGLRASATVTIGRASARVERAEHLVDTAADRGLREARQRLEVLELRVAAVDPVSARRRGWSMTTTADGRLVRSVDDIDVGTPLVTTVADGQVHSTVVSTTPLPPDHTTSSGDQP